MKKKKIQKTPATLETLSTGLHAVTKRLDATLRMLTLRFDAIDKHFVVIDERFEDVMLEFQRVDRKIDSRFDVLDFKIDAVAARLDKKIDDIDLKFDTNIAALDSKMMEGFRLFDGKMDMIHSELTLKIGIPA